MTINAPFTHAEVDQLGAFYVDGTVYECKKKEPK